MKIEFVETKKKEKKRQEKWRETQGRRDSDLFGLSNVSEFI